MISMYVFNLTKKKIIDRKQSNLIRNLKSNILKNAKQKSAYRENKRHKKMEIKNAQSNFFSKL